MVGVWRSWCLVFAKQNGGQSHKKVQLAILRREGLQAGQKLGGGVGLDCIHNRTFQPKGWPELGMKGKQSRAGFGLMILAGRGAKAVKTGSAKDQASR
jgi:hypothetical protein